jgi:hypothetical protein
MSAPIPAQTAALDAVETAGRELASVRGLLNLFEIAVASGALVPDGDLDGDGLAATLVDARRAADRVREALGQAEAALLSKA